MYFSNITLAQVGYLGNCWRPGADFPTCSRPFYVYKGQKILTIGDDCVIIYTLYELLMASPGRVTINKGGQLRVYPKSR